MRGSWQLIVISNQVWKGERKQIYTGRRAVWWRRGLKNGSLVDGRTFSMVLLYGRKINCGVRRPTQRPLRLRLGDDRGQPSFVFIEACNRPFISFHLCRCFPHVSISDTKTMTRDTFSYPLPPFCICYILGVETRHLRISNEVAGEMDVRPNKKKATPLRTATHSNRLRHVIFYHLVCNIKFTVYKSNS